MAIEAVVEATDLVVVRRGTRVLNGVTLVVRGGSVTGLLGPSGSGKTTLLRYAVGVQRITAGRLCVLGLPAGAAALRSRIGYVAQSPSVYADLSVRENLRYFGSVLGIPNGQVDEVIARVALPAFADRVVAQLSGGQQARVSLAAALLGKPELLVLDEPTVGLDPVLRRDLWQFFHELAAGGATLVVSSHVMDEAERCTDLLLLHEGRLFAGGSPHDIREGTGADDLEDAFLRLVELAPAPAGGAT